MNIFLLSLFPLSLIVFYFSKDQENRAKYLPVIFFGVFTGAVFLAYKLLFSSVYYIPRANIFINFVYYFFSEGFIPISVVFGLFFLFAHKDSLEDRFDFFFPAVVSFYAIFLPYLVLESQKPYPGFLLFIKPVLYLAVFIIHQKWINQILDTKSTKEFVTSILVMVFTLFIPALAEAMWIVDLVPVCWIIPGLLLCGYAGYLIFPKDSRKN